MFLPKIFLPSTPHVVRRSALKSKPYLKSAVKFFVGVFPFGAFWQDDRIYRVNFHPVHPVHPVRSSPRLCLVAAKFRQNAKRGFWICRPIAHCQFTKRHQSHLWKLFHILSIDCSETETGRKQNARRTPPRKHPTKHQTEPPGNPSVIRFPTMTVRRATKSGGTADELRSLRV